MKKHKYQMKKLINFFQALNFKIFKNKIYKILIFLIISSFSQFSSATTIAIGTGVNHTCAILSTGVVRCWGANQGGQLGDGTKTNKSLPVAVQGLNGIIIKSIAGGTAFTCGLATSGQVYCWGDNTYGQLGNGSYISSLAPVAVLLQTGPAIAISVGLQHACLLDTYGNVYCWGDNSANQLARTTMATPKINYPLYVVGKNDIASIAGSGLSTCTLDKLGGVKCFGYNSSGELGIGNTSISSTYPIYVTGLSSGVIAIAAATYSGCALLPDNAISCWGSNVNSGLGSPNPPYTSYIPMNVSGIRNNSIAINSNSEHTCILTATGIAQCWGSNSYGQLGRGTVTNAGLAADVAPMSESITSIVPASNHTCAMTTSGAVMCWGHNSLGQLGNGTTNDASVPTGVVGL